MKSFFLHVQNLKNKTKKKQRSSKSTVSSRTSLRPDKIVVRIILQYSNTLAGKIALLHSFLKKDTSTGKCVI